ncbi:hypothetical protein SLEP1_g18871 [Rubroshorea leprosula]|uniref:Uncharacterized protein n=1 Tax=Rubroshorea leprosula TaxID=152421 RepID=A0AAV5J9K7_9ROSI|nr:hypothetical protein SLEP1_g18871 [Rubroshorea leprosula]
MALVFLMFYPRAWNTFKLLEGNVSYRGHYWNSNFMQETFRSAVIP